MSWPERPVNVTPSIGLMLLPSHTDSARGGNRIFPHSLSKRERTPLATLFLSSPSSPHMPAREQGSSHCKCSRLPLSCWCSLAKDTPWGQVTTAPRWLLQFLLFSFVALYSSGIIFHLLPLRGLLRWAEPLRPFHPACWGWSFCQ